MSLRRIPPGAIKIDLPNVTQVDGHTCGPTALLAVCAYFGVGPRTQDEVERDMRITRAGSDPEHLVAAARRYGLSIREHRGMRDAALRDELDAGHPVLLSLQAWAEPAPPSYRERWQHGHWVVAIGHDRGGLYLEDPALHAARGFLTWAALADRWHDIEGPRRRRTLDRYGLAVWRRGVRGSRYLGTARPLD